MRKRVLIIGGFGFVGSQLLQLLERRNDLSLHVMDNGLSGGRLYGDYIYYKMDIRDRRLQYMIPGFDIIVHLAGIVGEPACLIDHNYAYDVNVNGTYNILNAMTDNQRIIFTSSSSVYGNKPNQIVFEDTTPLPINNYGLHKVLAENAIVSCGKEYIILRPATAFGISRRTRMDLLVNSLIYDALSYQRLEIYEPNTMRPIIHVLDFARILVEAIDGRLPANNVYNIADPNYNMTKLQLAETIALMCGAKVSLGLGTNLDPRNYDLCIDKLLATGFKFEVGRMKKAITQIKGIQYEIAGNRSQYTTPHKVEQYIAKNGKEGYGIIRNA